MYSHKEQVKLLCHFPSIKYFDWRKKKGVINISIGQPKHWMCIHGVFVKRDQRIIKATMHNVCSRWLQSEIINAENKVPRPYFLLLVLMVCRLGILIVFAFIVLSAIKYAIHYLIMIVLFVMYVLKIIVLYVRKIESAYK